MTVGFALRVLLRQGRRYDDLVLFHRDENAQNELESPIGGDCLVLSCDSILAPEKGPTIVIDRYLPRSLEDPAAWIKIATDGLVPDFRVADPVRVLMPDDQFWEIISVLEGSVDDDSIARLTEALSRMSFAEIVRFRDTLWQELHDLDHPGTTVQTAGDEGVLVHSDDSLYYRCEIVARGREAYAERVGSPRQAGDGDGARGEALLWVAQNAALHELGPSDVEIETGRNRKFWPESEPVEPAWEQTPSISAFSSRVLAAGDQWGEDDLLRRVHFTSFVAYASSREGRVRELMGCLMAASFDIARREVLAVLRSRLREDEVLDDRVRIWQSGAAHPMEGVALTGSSRRSTMPLDEYVDVYFRGELPNRRRR